MLCIFCLSDRLRPGYDVLSLLRGKQPGVISLLQVITGFHFIL